MVSLIVGELNAVKSTVGWLLDGKSHCKVNSSYLMASHREFMFLCT